MEKQLKKKKIITVILLIMLLAVYAMIFSFSADNGEASSDISTKVTKWLVQVYSRIINGPGEAGAAVPAANDALEGLIRKLAHFAEYMAVGFLSCGIIIMWVRKTSKSFIIVVIQLVISAGFDEIHQYFVPGRNSSVRDVMIDTAGGIAGMLIILCLKGISEKWKHIRQRK